MNNGNVFAGCLITNMCLLGHEFSIKVLGWLGGHFS